MLTALFSLLYLKKKKTALFASTSKSPKQKKKQKKKIINTISLQLVLAHLSLSLRVNNWLPEHSLRTQKLHTSLPN